MGTGMFPYCSVLLCLHYTNHPCVKLLTFKQMIFDSVFTTSLGWDAMANSSNNQNNPLYSLYSLTERSLPLYMWGARNVLLKSREQSHLLTPVGIHHRFDKNHLHSNVGSAPFEEEMSMSNHF